MNCWIKKKKKKKSTFVVKSTLEGSSILNLIWGAWASTYEVSVVVVTATTLLLKWCAWVYNGMSKEYFQRAKLNSRAGYSCY